MSRRVARRTLLAGTGGLLALPAIVRAQGRANGVALIVGNSRYAWEASLPNVQRDAPDVAAGFQALGVKTDLRENLGGAALRQAFEKFRDAARGANFAVFYYSGHGVIWGKETYIVPVDSDLSDPGTVKGLVRASSIADVTKNATHRLFVFDSCRNNPADGWRQTDAEQSAAISINSQRAAAAVFANVLTMFSTAPGHVAVDGPAGQNSPFAAALLRQLGAGAVDLRELSEKMRRDVLITTHGRQVLFDFNSYVQPFVLGTSGAPSSMSRAAAGAANMVELGNAYAFARANDIPLPAGLVALRSTSDGREPPKVGAFKFDVKGDGGLYPEIMVVLSVEADSSANAILAGKTPRSRYWRFVNGKVSGNRLEFLPRAGAARYMFDWRDANSGSVGLIWETYSNAPPFASRFTRLDG
jgi:hypothetical protein